MQRKPTRATTRRRKRQRTRQETRQLRRTKTKTMKRTKTRTRATSRHVHYEEDATANAENDDAGKDADNAMSRNRQTQQAETRATQIRKPKESRRDREGARGTTRGRGKQRQGGRVL